MKEYRFISDPGHGWLEVPLKDIPAEVKRKISHYSYVDKKTGMAYLEEDLDAGVYLGYLESKGEKAVIKNDYFDKVDIRDYPSFSEVWV